MPSSDAPDDPSSEEAERLEALWQYNVLDTPPEEQFDRIVRLATRWFDVPISLVTLLSENRQWFKAWKGIDHREIRREVSFCKHNIHDEEVLVLEDASKDPRFKDNPLVVGPPGIRFYAGAPLVTPGGHIIGSLCILDTEPRDVGSVDLEPLRDMAAIVVDELELRVANERLEEHNRHIQDLVEALTNAEETERQRLSSLLHEDLQQLLQAVRMKVETLSELSGFPEEHRERIEDVHEQIAEAIDVTRGLSARFAPPIGNEPLGDTFGWLAAKIEETYGLSVALDTNGPIRVPDETLKTLLYRIVRELLFNVVKHAETGEARLSLTREKEGLRVVVEDEGKGFVPDKQLKGGLGLVSIRERIEQLGGTIEIASQPGEGTRVVIEVPSSNVEVPVDSSPSRDR
jgi:signal transduction histidine kinase